MWKVFIDVSGMPQEDVYIGVILFNNKYRDLFISDFYNKFPKLRSYNNKSTKVKKDTLFDIIKFMSDKRLKMVCYKIKSSEFKKYEREINNLLKEFNINHKYSSSFKNFNEKILGILYYYCIIQIGIKKDDYQVIVCNEDHLDIWEVLNTIKKLSKRDGWKIDCSTNIRKIEHRLKFADYVAGAGRKVDEFKLDTIERFNLLRNPIKQIDLQKIFKVWPGKFLYKK